MIKAFSPDLKVLSMIKVKSFCLNMIRTLNTTAVGD